MRWQRRRIARKPGCRNTTRQTRRLLRSRRALIQGLPLRSTPRSALGMRRSGVRLGWGGLVEAEEEEEWGEEEGEEGEDGGWEQ